MSLVFCFLNISIKTNALVTRYSCNQTFDCLFLKEFRGNKTKINQEF